MSSAIAGIDGTNSRAQATVIPGAWARGLDSQGHTAASVSQANVFADRKKEQPGQGQNGHWNLVATQVIDNGSVEQWPRCVWRQDLGTKL